MSCFNGQIINPGKWSFLEYGRKQCTERVAKDGVRMPLRLKLNITNLRENVRKRTYAEFLDNKLN